MAPDGLDLPSGLFPPPSPSGSSVCTTSSISTTCSTPAHRIPSKRGAWLMGRRPLLGILRVLALLLAATPAAVPWAFAPATPTICRIVSAQQRHHGRSGGSCALPHRHLILPFIIALRACVPSSPMDLQPDDGGKSLYQELHRVGQGKFYLGVRGKGVGRGGVLVSSSDESIAAIMSRLGTAPTQSRFLIANRDQGYDDVYKRELQAVGARLVSPGLWETPAPLPHSTLAFLASLRGEVMPLTPICRSVASLLAEVALIGPLPLAGWSIEHERLDELEGGSPSSMHLALHIAEAMHSKPRGGEGGAVLVLLETFEGISLGLATHSRSPSILLSSRFKERPINFAAALDPPLAAAALSMLHVGPGDVLLDPCCGTGTILVGTIERGARAMGFDQSFKFAVGARANLDWLGLGNHVGGGSLRRLPASSPPWACAVAHHDARTPPAGELAGFEAPTVVLTNMPHGRYLQLPYKGYLREIFVSLAGASPSARFGFFHAAGDLQDDGPDNLFKALDELGFEIFADMKCKKMHITLAYGPSHPRNSRVQRRASRATTDG